MAALADEIKAILEDQVKDQKQALVDLQKAAEAQDGKIAKLQEEIAAEGKAHADTKSEFMKATEKVVKLEDNLDELAKKIIQFPGNPGSQVKSVGQLCADNLKDLNYKGGQVEIATVDQSLVTKAALIDGNTVGTAPTAHGGIAPAGMNILSVRDLFTTVPISTGAIEYARMGTRGTAGSQTAENTAKTETSVPFTKVTSAVETLAGWLPVSRQILDDSAMLRGVIDTELRYQLALEEERQLLHGTGAGGELTGVVPGATAYSTTPETSVTSPQRIDRLRLGILQAAKAGYPVTGLVLSLDDWALIQLTKTATDEAYIFANPVNETDPRLWGKRVVESSQMTAGTWLAGAFAMAATLYDRMQSTVMVADQHSDYFVKNMLALLVEERLALAVKQPGGFVSGDFTFV